MATDISTWIPEENGSQVISRVQQQSAIEALAKGVPMGSNTKSEPRTGAVDVNIVAAGGSYVEDTGSTDEVILTAKKFTGKFIVNEEDVADALAPVLESRKLEWATSYAISLDNACFGVTGAASPFESVYREVTPLENAATDGSVTYDELSELVAEVEGSFWNQASTSVVAHPAVREALRGVKDTTGNPIFVQGLAGTPDTLFGLAIRWSLGLKTAAAATGNPNGAGGAAGAAGNPLIAVANTDYLLRGDRTGVESALISPDANPSIDDYTLKMRARKAFALAQPSAAAVLEITSA